MTRPMSPHTPGPWKVVGLDVHACDERETVVAEVTGAISNESANADRRLIATAPDLLAALARLTEAVHLYSKDPGWLKSARAEAQAAIRKATAP